MSIRTGWLHGHVGNSVVYRGGADAVQSATGFWRDNDILTIPQLIRNRYGSRALQIASALLMSCGYVLFIFVMQIKRFGITASICLIILIIR